jgi:hypothetical protein
LSQTRNGAKNGGCHECQESVHFSPPSAWQLQRLGDRVFHKGITESTE